MDELGGELEQRHEPEKPTVEHPLAMSQEAPPGKCKDPVMEHMSSCAKSNLNL
ncbi:unnamed protein product [Rhodiola kirilowii]